jgi:uncharacterized heparinase superfamily protein
MSERPEDLPPADGIDEGKRLVRVGGDKGLSLAERLTDRFHRITWRTPIHGLRLKGRYPLKLIAVPDDPIFGDVARGEALLDGRLMFRGESHAIAGLDLRQFRPSAGCADYLQSCATCRAWRRARAARPWPRI